MALNYHLINYHLINYHLRAVPSSRFGILKGHLRYWSSHPIFILIYLVGRLLTNCLLQGVYCSTHLINVELWNCQTIVSNYHCYLLVSPFLIECLTLRHSNGNAYCLAMGQCQIYDLHSFAQLWMRVRKLFNCYRWK